MASLGVQFVAEMLATMVAIWMGECVLASELLAQSKGLHMGIAGVAIGFGLAFYVAVASFGSVSATLNPCTMFAKWICGKVTTEEWIVLSVAEFIGAFIGAFLVWLTYLGHFSLIPEVPDNDEMKQIKLAPTSVREAYISNPKGEKVRKGTRADNLRLRKTDAVVKHRATLQVAALLHERDSTVASLKDVHEKVGQDLVDRVRHRRSNTPYPVIQRSSHSASTENIWRPSNQMYSSAGSNIGSTPFEVASNRQRSSNLNFFDSDTRANTEVHSQMDFHDTSSDSPVGREQSDRQDNPQSNIQPMASQASDMSPYVIPENLLVYERLLIQDQNAKLSVFATRPAIYHWQTNLLSEIMAAFALIWFALMIEENGYLMPNEDGMTAFVNQTSPFMVGALVTGCVLGYVGPTGFAANAARDLAPRFFHFIAPIPNKGPSEWHYAWVPILGPYIGGTIAGLCFVGTRNLLTYPAWSSAIVSQQTMFGGLTDVF